MMKRIAICCALLTACAALWATNLTFMPFYPFKIGEKLHFTIHVLGVYIGDQEIYLEELGETNGQRVVVGSGHLYTTPVISALYKVDDRERTWFIPENFVPIYYERWLNEGSWKDNVKFRFFPDRNKVIISQRVNGWREDHVAYSGVLRNYLTLIASMRSVDYDYHIFNGIPVEINYLFGTALKTARLKPKYIRQNFKGKGTDMISLEEIGGIGMHFYVSRDADRTPLRLVIPTFEVLGFKTISVEVELKEFRRGSQAILPMSMIPSGATGSAPTSSAESLAENTNAPASSASARSVSSRKAVLSKSPSSKPVSSSSKKPAASSVSSRSSARK